MRIGPLIALVALFATACAAAAPRYGYRPTAATVAADAPGDLDGYAAAGYPVPRGEVKVATIGVTAAPRDGRGARPIEALHVRMVVHNGDSGPWLVEPRRQHATIDGAADLEPVVASCDGEVMPVAVLMPNDTRTIDLYYELPPALASAAAIPSVRVSWRVATPAGFVARETSAFERHDLPPTPVPPTDTKKMVKELAQARPEWPSPRDGL